MAENDDDKQPRPEEQREPENVTARVIGAEGKVHAGAVQARGLAVVIRESSKESLNEAMAWLPTLDDHLLLFLAQQRRKPRTLGYEGPLNNEDVAILADHVLKDRGKAKQQAHEWRIALLAAGGAVVGALLGTFLGAWLGG